MPATPSASREPTRGVRRDNSIQLDQVFNDGSRKLQDKPTEPRHYYPETATSCTDESIIPRRSHRSRAIRTASRSSLKNQLNKSLPLSYSTHASHERRHGAELMAMATEDQSIISNSSSRRSGVRRGRHCLASNSTRRSIRSNMSHNSLSILGGNADDVEKEEGPLSMSEPAHNIIPNRKMGGPPRTSSRLSDRVRGGNRRNDTEDCTVDTTPSRMSHSSRISARKQRAAGAAAALVAADGGRPSGTAIHNADKANLAGQTSRQNEHRSRKMEARSKIRNPKTRSHRSKADDSASTSMHETSSRNDDHNSLIESTRRQRRIHDHSRRKPRHQSSNEEKDNMEHRGVANQMIDGSRPSRKSRSQLSSPVTAEVNDNSVKEEKQDLRITSEYGDESFKRRSRRPGRKHHSKDTENGSKVMIDGSSASAGGRRRRTVRNTRDDRQPSNLSRSESGESASGRQIQRHRSGSLSGSSRSRLPKKGASWGSSSRSHQNVVAKATAAAAADPNKRQSPRKEVAKTVIEDAKTRSLERRQRKKLTPAVIQEPETSTGRHRSSMKDGSRLSQTSRLSSSHRTNEMSKQDDSKKWCENIVVSSGDDKSFDFKSKADDDNQSFLVVESGDDNASDVSSIARSHNDDDVDDDDDDDDDEGSLSDFANFDVFGDGMSNDGVGDVLQFDPTQLGNVQRVKQITSEKKDYDMGGQTGHIAEIVDPVFIQQASAGKSAPLFSLFDDADGAYHDDDDDERELMKEEGMEDNISSVSHRRKSLFRRMGRRKSDEDDNVDDSPRNIINPSTLGYEDPAEMKEKTSITQIAQKASGYIQKMMNASTTSGFSEVLDDDDESYQYVSNTTDKKVKGFKGLFLKRGSKDKNAADGGLLMNGNHQIGSCSDSSLNNSALFKT